jgi:general L-amino acid transport system substrate-binding protein
VCVIATADPGADSRLQQIRTRGFLGCGVSAGVAGFATKDAQGRYRGMDVDMCRAVAAAILGSGEKVRFTEIATLDQFRSMDAIDVVSRRLTWSLPREGLGVLFGPVMFYDGQGFLVPRELRIKTVPQLSNRPVCVVAGEHEFNLNAYFALQKLSLEKVAVRSVEQAAAELARGRCQAFSDDVSMLASARTALADGSRFDILAERISKEPLAQVVRQGDDQFFIIVRWTLFALIAAEEMGITSTNLDAMLESANPDIRRLLGAIPGNGTALGLDERWAYSAIKAAGNYGEVFERNVGMGSPLRLERGLNRLWTDGGLMYAPSIRP